jgi:hypothetical protein
MDALTACSYPELLDAMRDAAERQKKSALRGSMLAELAAHAVAISPVEYHVNRLSGTVDLGSDADVQAALRGAADRHERLAKVLWALANEMRPVRALEAAE